MPRVLKRSQRIADEDSQQCGCTAVLSVRTDVSNRVVGANIAGISQRKPSITITDQVRSMSAVWRGDAAQLHFESHSRYCSSLARAGVPRISRSDILHVRQPNATSEMNAGAVPAPRPRTYRPADELLTAYLGLRLSRGLLRTTAACRRLSASCLCSRVCMPSAWPTQTTVRDQRKGPSTRRPS